MRMETNKLNGETDDEDMEGFDDGSAQMRDIRDPGPPTIKEHPRDHTSTADHGAHSV